MDYIGKDMLLDKICSSPKVILLCEIHVDNNKTKTTKEYLSKNDRIHKKLACELAKKCSIKKACFLFQIHIEVAHIWQTVRLSGIVLQEEKNDTFFV